MLTRSLVPTVRKLCSVNSGAASQAVKLYHNDHFKPPTMDDLPVPEGSWEEANRRRQQKYNLHLLLGIGFTVFSLAVAKASGLFFLNFSPPARPADE